VFENKIQEILTEAKERMERRKLLPCNTTNKQIDYFFDKEEDDE
jgi:hypothetical protein